MKDIEKAIQLYEMMAARLKKTGWSPCQAAIYLEIAEFMRNECATIEEATEKLKNSPFYLAPSVALLKDKINALIRAAEDEKAEGVSEAIADVYRKKLAELDKDASAMHDAAYLITAHNIYIKHSMQISSFQSIYKEYLALEGNFDRTTYKQYSTPEGFNIFFSAFTMAFEQLERYGGDFVACSRRPEFREVISVSDETYQRFVRDALHYRSNPPNLVPEYMEAEKRIDAVWSCFKKEVIEEKMRTLRSGVGACLVVAPPDGSGDYEYTELVTLQNEQS